MNLNGLTNAPYPAPYAAIRLRSKREGRRALGAEYCDSGALSRRALRHPGALRLPPGPLSVFPLPALSFGTF